MSVARNAYKAAKMKEADEAIAKADAIQQEVARLAEGTQAAKVRAVTHQISELRAAIDWLLTSFEPQQKS